jgi:hypothetical protein
MAKTIFSIEEVELLDGTSVVLRPLSIKNQRKFFSKVEKERTLDDKKMLSASVDLVSELAVFCLQCMNETKDMTTSDLEDALDQSTALHVIKVCGGLDLTDENPKLGREETPN